MANEWVSESWTKLREQLGDEAARAHVVQRLRALANHIESNKQPALFIYLRDKRGGESPFIDYEITLSDYWGG